MRVYFEGYHYKKSDIEKSLCNDSAGEDNLIIPSDSVIQECFTDSSLYQEFGKQEDPEIKFNCVGYFHCPKINDSIFVMPKVFVNVFKDGEKKVAERVFATEENKIDSGFAPEELIFKNFFDNIDANDDTRKDKDKRDALNFITSTAIWIYQSIKRYVENKFNSGNLNEANLQRVTTTPGQSTETLLDTIISLIQFYKEHKSLFTFIAINRNHGTSRINWRKTINRKLPTLNNRKPVYFDFYTKNKVVNYDEELIVLFLSTMEYVRQKFYFSAIEHEGYELLPPHVIQNLLETGKGIRKMNEIRHKYFSDELVLLWQLMMQFFRQTYDISAKHYIPEMLIVRKYDRIFEDMVDCLIGEDLPKSIKYMKNQDDGKNIDHIYREKSVFSEDDQQIFYIGDSKYYKEEDADGYIKLSKNSVAKQFTYAKNVIQYCMNIFNGGADTDNVYKKEEKDLKSSLHYRDALTEGYNITPNFFLHGRVFPEHINEPSKAFEEDKIDLVENKEEENKRINFQWENRLFDRDTLILQTYNINFLYLLSMYVGRHENAKLKADLRKKFRSNFIKLLEKKYVFFEVIPRVPMEEYVNMHFRKYIGKMFRPNDKTLIFAFDRTKQIDVSFMQDNVYICYYHFEENA